MKEKTKDRLVAFGVWVGLMLVGMFAGAVLFALVFLLP